jgi:predicted lipoprotein with Yx(FWY)xxD motif
MTGTLPTRRRMPRKRLRARFLLGAGLAGVALVLIPLGASAATHKTKTVTALAETHNATLGTILTNTKGFTVYTFTEDSPNKSNCTGGCAKVWPPVVVPKGDKLKTLKGVKGIGTIPRGKELQLTFDKKPLYLFAGDKSAGQATGQGVANTWFAVVLKAAPTTPTTAAPVTTPAATPTTAAAHSSSSSSNSNSNSNSTPPATSPPATTQPPPTTTSPPTTTQPPVVQQPNPPASPSPPSGGYGY